jgi:microcystin-dependent protein
MPTNFTTRKLSELPPKTPLTNADFIIILGDGTPPDGMLGSVAELAVLAGAQAPEGPEGPEGPAGPPGPPGNDLAIDGTVATQGDLSTVTADDGDVYVVQGDGSLWAYDSVLGWTELAATIGPEGPEGPKGETGPAGATGPTGPTGPEGPAGSSVPTGTVLDYAGATAPIEFVLCDGAYYDPANPLYTDLYNVIGYTYGKNASNFYRVPPINGRTVVGLDGNDATFGTLGKLLGSKHAAVVTHRHSSGTFKVAAHGHSKGTLTTIQHRHSHVHTHSSGAGTNQGFVVSGSSGYPDYGFSFESTGGTYRVFSRREPTAGASDNYTSYSTPGITGSTGDTAPDVTGYSEYYGEAATDQNIQPSIVLNKIIKL